MNGRIFEHMTSAHTRQREMLAEAERIHTAAKAVRQTRTEHARRAATTAAATRSQTATSARLMPAAACPRPGEPVGQVDNRPSSNVSMSDRRAVWHRAARSVGNSLVRVGRRLERIGDGRDGVRDR